MRSEDVAALLALDLTQWWRTWIITAVMTGLRPGELLALGWDDIDFSAGVIRVRFSIKAGKDGGGRTVLRQAELKTERSRRTLEMPAAVRATLTALRRVQAAEKLAAGSFYEDAGLVFADSAGRAKWRQSVNGGFKDLCAQAGIGTRLPGARGTVSLACCPTAVWTLSGSLTRWATSTALSPAPFTGISSPIESPTPLRSWTRRSRM
jgi:integrase